MTFPFIAKPAELEEKIREWKRAAGGKLQVDSLTSFSGHEVYALTLTDPNVPVVGKRRHYFAQPHAHEPGTTAGMADVIEQLVTGHDLRGQPTTLDVEKVLATTVLTFNPIGNPQGREAAPVLYWNGVDYDNEQFWCWMRGEDPNYPGRMWGRFDVWDDREVEAPDPVGIVYEQIDEHRYVEPNRSHLSTYFKLFFHMDSEFHYECWLSLHQTEFVRSEHNCMILLPLEGLAEDEVLEADWSWGVAIVDAWRAAGFRPVPSPRHLGYTGDQARYFRENWGDLHKRMNIITTEVKNNARDATPEFQMDTQVVAIQASIERLL